MFIPCTEKQVSKLAHLIARAELGGYGEQIINGKAIKTMHVTTEKLKGLSLDQANHIIGLFKAWERSYDEVDLSLPLYALTQYKII